MPSHTPQTPAEGLRLATEPAGPSAVVLVIEGELDMATAPALRESLTAALDAGATRVVADLSAVAFMDSVALATLLQARRRLGDGGRFAFVSPARSYTRLILEIAGGVTRLHVFETREQAVAHVGA